MTSYKIDGVDYWDAAEILAYTTSIGKPIKKNTFSWYITMGRLTPELRIGQAPLFTPEQIKAFFTADRHSGTKKQPSPEGYYSIDEMAGALGISTPNFMYYIKAEAVAADYIDERGRRWFNQATLNSMKRGEHRIRQPYATKARRKAAAARKAHAARRDASGDTQVEVGEDPPE